MLKEVQELDLTLPPEMFPNQDTPVEAEDGSDVHHQSDAFFLWNVHRNGLAERLGGPSANSTVAFSKPSISQSRSRGKRGRSDDAVGAVGNKRLKKSHSIGSMGTADEQKRNAKLRRRLVEVDVAKAAAAVDPPLMKLHQAALNADLQAAVKVQVCQKYHDAFY